MAFFHHGIIRKYTLALLSTFNNIEIQKLKSDGITYSSSIVPIRFSSREKSTLFSEVETSQITNGNFNIIPRASLVFNSIQKASERTTSKFNKINRQVSSSAGTDIVNYQYNSVPYDFSFSLIIQADGMNEASMIAEQILPRFNPVYTIAVNEIPLQEEPTSIAISLEGSEFEQSDYDTFTSNMVTMTFDLTLKGNIYPPITDAYLINQIKIFNNKQDGNEFERVSRIDWERQIDDTFGASVINFSERIRKVKPVILSIAGEASVAKNSSHSYIVEYSDEDNKNDELVFLFNIVSLDTLLPAEIGSLTHNKNICTFASGVNATTFKLQCIITDIHGNISDAFYKNITIA